MVQPSTPNGLYEAFFSSSLPISLKKYWGCGNAIPGLGLSGFWGSHCSRLCGKSFYGLNRFLSPKGSFCLLILEVPLFGVSSQGSTSSERACEREETLASEYGKQLSQKGPGFPNLLRGQTLNDLRVSHKVSFSETLQHFSEHATLTTMPSVHKSKQTMISCL